jgi:hypothetical protein
VYNDSPEQSSQSLHRRPQRAEAAADRSADREMVALEPIRRAWKLGGEDGDGLTTPKLGIKGLMRLQMGEDLTNIVRGGTRRPIATTGGARSRAAHLASEPPAAAIAPAVGGIDLTCRRVGSQPRVR